ncbi:MAG TPA: hypothetical protein G4N96_11825 [Chloroflexi bacterium]|nr:hypothetical protein [Chloroflexota bacterium]
MEKNNLLDQLIGLTPEDMDILKTISQTGAVTAEETALKLDRPGDDLSPQMKQLVKRQLVEANSITVDDESFEIYMVDPVTRKKLAL